MFRLKNYIGKFKEEYILEIVSDIIVSLYQFYKILSVKEVMIFIRYFIFFKAYYLNLT